MATQLPVLTATVLIAFGLGAVASEEAVKTGEGSFVAGIGRTTTGQGSVGPLTPDQIFAANTGYLDDYGCAGLHFLAGQCDVPVACGDGQTEQLRVHQVLAGERPASRCPADIAAEVLRAFQQVPLPPAELTIQPPDGTTLVNLDTNFYTAAEPFTTTVTLLDQTITLHIRPTAFTWTFGDGTTRTTTTPGAPYPDLQVTHAYTQPGTVTTQLTTTWSADYQIGTGPTHTVDGTVTMTSDPVPLRIREATPVLVD